MEELRKFLEENNVQDIDGKMEKFRIYYEYLVEYNQNVNLTSITEEYEVYIKHFLDSILPVMLIKQNATVCDIGTGAGFPSVPLAIVRDDIKVLACDSLNKRIVFLDLLKEKLGLKNLTTIHSRAEDMAKYRQSFDYVVARAVAQLNILSEYCLPLVKVGGTFLAYKGSNYKEESQISEKAINILGGRIKNIHKYLLPAENGERAVFEIEKIKDTPQKYPRGGNKPRLKPL